MTQAPMLRPFQSDVVDRIDAEIAAGRKRVLVPLPTGSGKTILASELIRREAERGRRVVFLVHRRELTKQTARKLYDVGIDTGIVQAGFQPRPGQPVQIASVQTLSARAIRTRTMDLPEADWVFVDEAHHVRARSYEKILERYPYAVVIGLTATPCRSDGRGLGNVFDAIVQCPTVADLIAAGFLVPTRVYAPSTPDLKGVKVLAGDYHEKQLAERVDTPKLVGDIVEHYHRHAQGRPTVAFATTVAHSVHIRDEFRRSGVNAEHIDGNTPVEERDAILARLERREIDVVTNCAVLTEGWDQPAVSCLILARPTKSLGLFRQMIGRVLRPAPGKEHALILDHSGATFAHGFAEDEIAWTLEEDDKAANKAHASRGTAPGMPRLCECPECTAVMYEGRGCTTCGWRPRPKPRSFETADGQLGEVGHERRAHHAHINRLEFYGELLWIARDRGFKPGWAYHKYREKFGTEPKWRSAAQIPPKPETLSWVRSRQIAYAKAMEKNAA